MCKTDTPKLSLEDEIARTYYPRHFYFSKEKASAAYLIPLNDKVEAIAKKALKARAENPDTRLPPHILLHKDGAFVYPKRYFFLPVFFTLFAAWLVTLTPNLFVLLVSVLLCYFEYDLYSGVLHIVLDDPKNLGKSNYIMEAIMFQGCLEFQWHHEIPRDIVEKGILSSCADLNVAVVANVAAIFAVVGGPLSSPDNRLFWSLLGVKLFYGYFGQINHAMAHRAAADRPAVVQALQNASIMLDQKKHNSHHRTYDENFCLLGQMDWAVHLIDRCIPKFEQRHYVWFAIWMLMSVFSLSMVIKPIVIKTAELAGFPAF